MKISLPEKFEHRMREQLGEEYEDYLKCFGERCRAGLRVNTLKLSPEEFERLSPFPLERIPWIENGFFYPDEEQPSKHSYYFGGLYYLQEPSAMTPASLLPVKPGDRVLDVCAAPGGKSTELAARLGGEGVLVSNDISNSRAKALLKNLELFGVKNAVVVSEAPSKLAGRFAGYFDKILVDAPCSGEGMFRKSPAIMKNWEQYGTGYYNELQKQILPEAIRMLRPGGYLLYSTCTFSPEENEGTVQYVLDNFPEMELVPALPAQGAQESGGGQDAEEQLYASAASAPWKPDYTGMEHGRPEWVEHGSPLLALTLRLWPHKIKGEGHFIALLRKKGEDTADGAGQKAPEVADVLPFRQGNGEEPVIGRSFEQNGAKKAEDGRFFGQKTGKEAEDSRAMCRKSGSDAAERRIMRRKNEGSSGKGAARLPEEAEEFLAGLHFDVPRERLRIREDRLYLLPEGLPDLSGLRILRSGLLLGEMKKNRFEPSQALACALKKSEYDNCYSMEPDDPDIIRYLKCETIEPKQPLADGFVLVCAGEYPLGWGKQNNKSFKTRYLPGWRMM